MGSAIECYNIPKQPFSDPDPLTVVWKNPWGKSYVQSKWHNQKGKCVTNDVTGAPPPFINTVHETALDVTKTTLAQCKALCEARPYSQFH